MYIWCRVICRNRFGIWRRMLITAMMWIVQRSWSHVAFQKAAGSRGGALRSSTSLNCTIACSSRNACCKVLTRDWPISTCTYNVICSVNSHNCNDNRLVYQSRISFIPFLRHRRPFNRRESNSRLPGSDWSSGYYVTQKFKSRKNKVLSSL